MCTFSNILQHFTDQEIKDVHSVAIGKVPHISSRCTSIYKEIQVHGPLKLSRDVKAVVVNRRHWSDESIKRQLEEFRDRNFCSIIWMDAH